MRMRWHGDYAPPEEHIERSVQPPLIPRVRGIVNIGGQPIEYVPGPGVTSADGTRTEHPTGERGMPCIGNYNPDNYACVTACACQLECMRATGIENPRRTCFGRFDNFPIDYQSEHCVSCEQVRACIHTIGIKNILIGGSHIIPKPAEAPDCFGYFYDHSNADGQRPSLSNNRCVGTCEFYSDCVRVTHSAQNFEQETRRSTGDARERREQMRSEDLESRQKKARDLEVVPAGDNFLVKSSTRKGGYMVTPEDDGTYHCACMDYATHRGDPEWKCKHIIAVKTFLEERGPTSSDSRWGIIDIK